MTSETRPGEPTPLGSVIAENVRAIRTRQGTSIAELAARAGIDESAWAELESGNSEPAPEALWGVAAALGVSFSQLVEQDLSRVRLLRASAGITGRDDGGDLRATLKVSSGRRASFEMFVIEPDPGVARRADGHAEGTVEHLLLLAGSMRAGPEGAAVLLAPGDVVSFPGDVPHLYETLEAGSRALLLMEHP